MTDHAGTWMHDMKKLCWQLLVDQHSASFIYMILQHGLYQGWRFQMEHQDSEHLGLVPFGTPKIQTSPFGSAGAETKQRKKFGFVS